MQLSKKDRQKLKVNPTLFFETAIKEYVAASPANRLPNYNNEPVINEPLVGIADGYDPIFQEFKKESIIGNYHLTPGEALMAYLEKQKKPACKNKPTSLSVISIAFTFPQNTRMSNTKDGKLAAPRWSYAYGQAFKLMSETLSHLVSLLEATGYQAVAPVCTRPMSIMISADGLPYTDWSEKHAAYAAGLGTFGLNTSLITPSGLPVHCGSVITDLVVKSTPRAYDNHHAYCLFYQNGSCQTCAKHCPSGAVNIQAFDGKKCMFYAQNDLPKISRELNGETEPGGHPMCALCQIRVPCETGIPPQ
jgi:epoxyqueuosine reductase